MHANKSGETRFWFITYWFHLVKYQDTSVSRNTDTVTLHSTSKTNQLSLDPSSDTLLHLRSLDISSADFTAGACGGAAPPCRGSGGAWFGGGTTMFPPLFSGGGGAERSSGSMKMPWEGLLRWREGAAFSDMFESGLVVWGERRGFIFLRYSECGELKEMDGVIMCWLWFCIYCIWIPLQIKK